MPLNKEDINISTELCGITLKNPTVLASGVLGMSIDLLRRLADAGAGALTIKSITNAQRTGHKNPTVIAYEAGMLNAVGYSNPGAVEAVREFSDVGALPVPVFASVVGQTAEEFATAAERIMKCPFKALELPLSCPHTPGYGTLAGHGTPEATEEITRAVCGVTDRPVFVKLSPNVPAIGELALAALEGGAGGITAVNSMGPGMLINIDSRRPVLDFGSGGVSGPALRPVALRCVYDVYKAIHDAGRTAPIIGVGGVSCGDHAMQMIMAGASAVGVGTAVYQLGPKVFGAIARELKEICLRLGADSLRDMTGAAHG